MILPSHRHSIIHALCLGMFCLVIGLPVHAADLPDELTLKVNVTMASVTDTNTPSIRPKRQVEERTLVLKRYTVRAQDHKLQLWKDGKMETVPAPAVRTYRGCSKQEPNERVCAVVYPNGTLDAYATTGVRWIWHVSEPPDVTSQIRGPAGTNDGRDRWPGGHVIKRDPGSLPLEVFPPVRAVKRVRVMADITHQCVVQKRTGGGWEAALAWTEWQAALADENYTRNLAISVELAGAVIRTAPFYPNDFEEAANFLDGVKSGWAKVRDTWKPDLDRGAFDFANAFTVFLGGGWSAGPFSYGTFNHELGHCFDMQHDNYGIDMQNPVNLATALRFFDEKERLKGYLDAPPAEHPEPVHPMTYPDVIVTRMDAPIPLRVLANDFDSNGEKIRITAFSAKTRQGGTVQKIEYTEKSGTRLDDLGYTPPRGFIGKDAVIYTVTNESGLYQTEVAHIHVVDDRAPVAAHWALDRMDKGLSPDDQKPQRHAKLPASATVVKGPVSSGIEIRSGEKILLGDCDILPERPKDFHPRGEQGRRKNTWYPLEEEIGNDFDPLNLSYTLAFWFKRGGSDEKAGTSSSGDPNDQTLPGILVDKADTPNKQAVGYRITATAEGLSLHLREFNGHKDELSLTHQDTCNDGRWHHVAFIVDRTGTQEARLYLDGRAARTALPLSKGSYIFAGRGDLRLCALADGSTAFDDVYITYRAISASDVKTLHKRGIPVGGS